MPSVSVSARNRSSNSFAGAAGSGVTRAGSLAISAVGISSRTWWKAQRWYGGVRQFASVTCASRDGGNASIRRVIRIESYLE